MKTALRIVVVIVLIAACISSESLSADFGGPPGDGWYTWRVAKVRHTAIRVELRCTAVLDRLLSGGRGRKFAPKREAPTDAEGAL